MTGVEQALLIILSAALAVFLILGIISLVKINQILGHIRHITEKAEKLADQAEHVGEFFQKTASSTAVVKLLSNIVSSFKSNKSEKGD